MRLHPRSLLLFALTAVLAIAGSVFAQAGPPGGTIYAHDEMYKTVGTPADLPPHGNFDIIYVLGDGLANVAEAAPGDMDWNGGRWEVRPITWNIPSYQVTNAEEIEMLADNGDITIGEPVRYFECPLIKKR